MNKKEIKLKIYGMSCDDCAVTIEKNLLTQNGIIDAKVSYEEKAGIATIDADIIKPEDILKNRIFSSDSKYKAIIKKE
ncbi:MAG: heavy-metal-associated domain-containing protein [Thermoplasmata archaeon]